MAILATQRSRKQFVIAAAALVIACGLFALVFFMLKKPANPIQTSSVSGNISSTTTTAMTPPGATTSASSASSSQEAIDTGLSLGPTPTAGTSPQLPSTPAATYAGCDLSLAFEISGGNLAAEGTMSYKLIAQNLGSVLCQSASVSVYYASGESFASASPTPTADGYYWTFGSLAPGGEETIALTTNRNGAATTDEACLSADNGTDACANASPNAAVTAVAAPSLPLTATITSAFPASSGGELGVWEWTTLTRMSANDMQNIVNEAAANNFNVIYLTVDDYLTIDNMPDGTAKQEQLTAYEQAASEFLDFAAQKNIAVDAESGAQDWGQSGNTWEASEILNFVANYNQTHAIKFRGVQYDIEPYLLTQYQNNEAGVLTAYVNLVSELVAQDKSIGLPLTIIVPHFYDANEQWTPEITIGGDTDYTYRQILRLLNELPNGDGRIIIMAYRNFAIGSDGSIDLSQSEIQEANATNVKVLVAQETGPVTPAYVTFSGLSRSALFTQVGLIDQSFASDKSFGGIAIDYLDPFLDLH